MQNARYIFSFSVLALLLAAPARAEVEADRQLRDLQRGQPADVADVMERWLGCKYWATRPRGTAERNAEIRDKLTQMKCRELEADEAKLRVKYARSKRTLDALTAARDLTY